LEGEKKIWRQNRNPVSTVDKFGMLRYLVKAKGERRYGKPLSEEGKRRARVSWEAMMRERGLGEYFGIGEGGEAKEEEPMELSYAERMQLEGDEEGFVIFTPRHFPLSARPRRV